MGTTPRVTLLQPLSDGVIPQPEFFNGRLLTAEALAQGQEAGRIGDRRLGQAIGEGVAYGLFVTKEDKAINQVTVTAGLAVTRDGRAFHLMSEVLLDLVPPAEPKKAVTSFGPCAGSAADATGAQIGGAYILTLAPAETYAGAAGMSGPPLQDVAGCGRASRLEGVQFRMQRLDLPETLKLDDKRRRSQLAHFCLGTDSLFEPKVPQQYGPLDKRGPDPAVGLTACQVPLALLWWASGKLEWVDVWAVRRSLAVPYDSSGRPLDFTQRRLAEAEARFMQFEDQVRSDCAGIRHAADTFEYLPPAGVLPAEVIREDFFRDTKGDSITLEQAYLRSEILSSFSIDPMPLSRERPAFIELAVLRSGETFFRRFRNQARGVLSMIVPGEIDVSESVQVNATIGNKGGPGWLWCTISLNPKSGITLPDLTPKIDENYDDIGLGSSIITGAEPGALLRVAAGQTYKLSWSFGAYAGHAGLPLEVDWMVRVGIFDNDQWVSHGKSTGTCRLY